MTGSDIEIIPLGAGQDVGRSCILLCMGGKRIMLDCGMHMGYSDEMKFPDFKFISVDKPITEYIDCVLISHFHLDHCGALPYLTEMVGYDGPIYMSMPTKAICPHLLEDFRKITLDKEDNVMFTSEMIQTCMRKVSTIGLNCVVEVDDQIRIKAYYAGHVIGAVMFHIQVGDLSAVYTGDFHMSSDSHLGSAWIDRCRPDVLISESTYATTVRESRKCRESDFLRKVHEIVEGGGKVLIPVFALGRAQELCLLLEDYWTRKNLSIPIYFSTGLAEKAMYYYKLYLTWTNERIKRVFSKKNYFDFEKIQVFDRSLIDMPGPMVVLASPGMLHAGLSLQLFKRWAGCEKNAVILPGYCVRGTVGELLISGQRVIDCGHPGSPPINVKLQVQNMSFSAHADAQGILQLIDFCRPKRAVVFVHGEAETMIKLSEVVKQQFNIECHCPMNGKLLSISGPGSTSGYIKTTIDRHSLPHICTLGCKRFHGYFVIDRDKCKEPPEDIDVNVENAAALLVRTQIFPVNAKSYQPNKFHQSLPDVLERLNSSFHKLRFHVSIPFSSLRIDIDEKRASETDLATLPHFEFIQHLANRIKIIFPRLLLERSSDGRLNVESLCFSLDFIPNSIDANHTAELAMDPPPKSMLGSFSSKHNLSECGKKLLKMSWLSLDQDIAMAILKFISDWNEQM